MKTRLSSNRIAHNPLTSMMQRRTRNKQKKFDCVSTATKSLFSAFYLLALIGKILGVFPLQNVTRIGRKCSGGEFQYCSMAYLYSWLFLPLNVAFMVFAQFFWSSNDNHMLPDTGNNNSTQPCMPRNASECPDQENILPDPQDPEVAIKVTDFLIIHMNTFLQSVIVFGNNIVAILSGRKVSKIFQEVCEIESTFGYNKHAWRGVRNYAIKIYLWLPMAGFLYFVAYYVREVGVSIEAPPSQPTSAQLIIISIKTILVLSSTIPELIFAFLCKIAGEFLQQNKTNLCKEVEQAIMAIRMKESGQEVATVLEGELDIQDPCVSVQRHQSNHLRIAQFVEKLNRAYSKILANTLACSACIVCFSIYVGANAYFDMHFGVGVVCVVTAVVFAVRMAIVTEAGNFVESVADRCMRELVQASYDCEPEVSEAFRRQMNSFYVQAMNHPIKPTASEYFTVNRVFLITGFGTVFNYLIILLQIRINSSLSADNRNQQKAIDTTTSVPNDLVIMEDQQ